MITIRNVSGRRVGLPGDQQAHFVGVGESITLTDEQWKYAMRSSHIVSMVDSGSLVQEAHAVARVKKTRRASKSRREVTANE